MHFLILHHGLHGGKEQAIANFGVRDYGQLPYFYCLLNRIC
jgi:hypothetical protein